MTDMPKDMVARLRQVSLGFKSGSGGYPQWFTERCNKEGGSAVWHALLAGAADELEQMRQLAGRLLKRVAGD